MNLEEHQVHFLQHFVIWVDTASLLRRFSPISVCNGSHAHIPYRETHASVHRHLSFAIMRRVTEPFVGCLWKNFKWWCLVMGYIVLVTLHSGQDVLALAIFLLLLNVWFLTINHHYSVKKTNWQHECKNSYTPYFKVMFKNFEECITTLICSPMKHFPYVSS